ncbi:MAG: hypothetical protein HYT40_03445, partial [Candidatus Sungbacteria bacterium]|nr:hypothetical protein [Candidatus Sungbacteria bacterium]
MAKMISLKGLNKADVLAALYNASKPLAMGFMHYDPKPMTRQQAEALLKHQTDFDYLQGRVMKVDLSEDDFFDPRLYDRDNGQGAAEKVIEALRRSGDTNPADIQAAHYVNTLESAEETEDRLGTASGPRGTAGSMAVFELGLKDVAGPLHKKVQEARRKL